MNELEFRRSTLGPVKVLEKIDEPLNELSLEDLIKILYEYPIHSTEFKEIHYWISEKLTDEKYNELVIAFKSKMHSDYTEMISTSKLDELNNIKGLREIVPDEMFNYLIFSKGESFLEDSRFEILPRRMLEYNPSYKQLCVSTYITDGQHIILLKTLSDGDTRIKDRYTFIQGHVVFTPDIYIMSEYDFLKANAMREFHEEVKLTDEAKRSKIEIRDRFFINDTTYFIGLEHFGIVYELYVPNAAKLFKEMSSGEPNKHDVVLLDLAKIDQYDGIFDHWVQLVLKKLI